MLSWESRVNVFSVSCRTRPERPTRLGHRERATKLHEITESNQGTPQTTQNRTVKIGS